MGIKRDYVCKICGAKIEVTEQDTYEPSEIEELSCLWCGYPIGDVRADTYGGIAPKKLIKDGKPEFERKYR